MSDVIIPDRILKAFGDAGFSGCLERGWETAIVGAWPYIQQERDLNISAKQRACATAKVEILLDGTNRPHAGCLRAFITIARLDWSQAERLFGAIEDLYFS